jgi:hypothetical protein
MIAKHLEIKLYVVVMGERLDQVDERVESIARDTRLILKKKTQRTVAKQTDTTAHVTHLTVQPTTPR